MKIGPTNKQKVELYPKVSAALNRHELMMHDMVNGKAAWSSWVKDTDGGGNTIQVQENITTTAASTVVVKTKEFTAELEWAARFIGGAQCTIPIIQNIALRSNAGVLELSATDLEVAGITTVQGSGEDFAITIPAKLALKYLKKVPEPELTLSVSGLNLTIRHGDDSECTVSGMSMDAYPVIPAVDSGAVRLSGLSKAIERVLPAIAKEESRFTLNGALLETGINTKLVSTDGHRLSVAALESDSVVSTKAIVPKFALMEVDRLGEDSMLYSMNADFVQFIGARRRIVSRKLTNNFPDYGRVIPGQTCCAVVDAVAFKKHGERVALFADERSHAVKLTLADNKLTIAASVVDAGKAKASIATAWEQPEWASAFNWEYLADFVAVAPKTAFELHFRPVAKYPEAVTLRADAWDYVVMPMRG